MHDLKKAFMAAFILGMVFLMGCMKTSQVDSTNKLVIADQFGLAYAPIEIMKKQGFLEEELKRIGLDWVEIEWKRMGNTTAIREAMISGNLDIGFVGIPPFLIGADHGMDWRIISGVSESPSALLTNSSQINSIVDLDESHRIILPQPGSIQHILLSMYTERELGDSKKYDNQLVSMSHPDGMVAMGTGDGKQLHFTTPPFMQQEINNYNASLLLDGQMCFGGDFTFIVGICQEEIYLNQSLYSAFVNAMASAMDFIENRPEETLEILANSYEYDREELSDYLAHPQMNFNMEVKGMDQFVDFMVRQELISEEMRDRELFWSSYEE